MDRDIVYESSDVLYIGASGASFLSSDKGEYGVYHQSHNFVNGPGTDWAG